MKELLLAVEKLANEELNRSYKKFPSFHSPHEGYAVIKEELEETDEEVTGIKHGAMCMWSAIRCNDVTPVYLNEIKEHAIHAAAEAIQVAAMAQKFLNSGCASEPVEGREKK